MNIKKYKLVLMVIMLILPPLLLWFNAPSPQPRFANFSATLTSLGQILGLVGVVLFAINLILSTRLRILDRYFNGLNNVYLKHNQIGQIALILLLLHPLLLISKYATTLHEAALFLWLGSDWAINWGILSLGLMIFLIALTLYVMPKYNIWKWTHKFLGLAFFLAALHIWLIPSDVSTYVPLRIYILGFSALGFIAFVYKSILGKFLIKKYKYIVTNVDEVNNLVTEVRLKAQGEKLIFNPGQFVFLNFIDNNIGFESHPFSLISSPHDDYISVLIKNVGDYTSKISEVTPGTIAEVEGPFGNFSFEKFTNKSQVWIAGGIGITPFISLAKSLSPDLNYKIDLVYCVKNRSEAVKLNLLENISTSVTGFFNIVTFYSDDRGHISIDTIKSLSENILEKEILICAPPQMIKALRQALVVHGLKKEHIHSEEFSF